MDERTSPGDAEGLPNSRLLTRQEKWRQRNPLAYRAHRAVKYALRRGKLVKEPCAECGSPHSEAHHPNYEQPLVVIWLCRVHHRRRHPPKRRKILKRRGAESGN